MGPKGRSKKQFTALQNATALAAAQKHLSTRTNQINDLNEKLVSITKELEDKNNLLSIKLAEVEAMRNDISNINVELVSLKELKVGLFGENDLTDEVKRLQRNIAN